MSNDLPHGERFAPLSLDTLTPEQKVIADRILSGARGRISGPWNGLLRSPRIAEPVERLGEYVRFHSCIPYRLYEFTVLLVARHLTAQYPWSVHYPLALKAGIAPQVVEQIAAGVRPSSGMQEDEAVIYDFCTELLRRHDISEVAYKAMTARFGEQGIIDLIGIIGYYNLIGLVMIADRFPPQAGAPVLAPLPMAGSAP
jgi:4-carboxymuconolactone decarboxylase